MNGPEKMGEIQWRLLARAEGSMAGMVYVTSYQELRAARKLSARGILVQQGMLPLFFWPEKP